MAGMRMVADFTRVSSGGTRRRILLTVFGTECHSGVDLVEMSLEAFFGFFGHPGEFDAHANAGVAGANYSGGSEALFFDPQVHSKRSTDGQRHDSLHITAIPADICGIHAQRSIDTLVTQFDWIRNLVAGEFSAIVLALLGPLFHFHVRGKSRGPGTFLVEHELHS